MAFRQIVGFLLVAIGIAVLLWGGLFWTRNKTVIDAGPVQVSRQQHEGISLPPVVGVISIVAGVAVLALRRRQRV